MSVQFGPMHPPPLDDGSNACGTCLTPLFNADGTIHPSDDDNAEGVAGVSVLPCGHEIHTACLKKWERTSLGHGGGLCCPDCRAPFERFLNPEEQGGSDDDILIAAINSFAQGGGAQVLQILLRGNLNINYMATDERGDAAVYLAIRSRVPDDLIVELMQKIDIQNNDPDELDVPYNQFNNRNQTALDAALEVGASEHIMAELRARGARAHNELAP